MITSALVKFALSLGYVLTATKFQHPDGSKISVINMINLMNASK
jgi:hypothetical protein